jgi:Zn-dependent protease
MAGVDPTTAPPQARRSGIPLGRVLGFPVRLNWSVVLLAALVTMLLGPYSGYLVGVGFVVFLVVSVLLHELGHALTARRLGVGVRGITLEILGGFTEMDRESPSPRVELLVALAGPAVSLVIGLTAGAAAVLLPDGTALQRVMVLAAFANVVVAVFNALPGLPLDGGRALRAAVWALTGKRLLATLVAARSGQGLALLTLAGAVALWSYGVITTFGLLFTLLVALTLWQGASGAAQLARVQQRVPLLDLDRLARPIFTVPTGTPLAEAQRRAAESGPPGAALAVVDSAGQVIAVVNRRAAQAVPPERRPWVSVDTVARDVNSLRTVPTGLRGQAAVAALQHHPAGEYLLTHDGRIVGLLHLSDVSRMLRPPARRARR